MENLNIILQSPLFKNIDKKNLDELLQLLKYSKKNYKKDEKIFSAGFTTQKFCLVLTGKIQIENNDFWGNKTILNCIFCGQIFAETYALNPDEPLMVDAIALEESSVLFLDIQNFLRNQKNDITNQTFIKNFLFACAKKNLELSKKINCISPKKIRDRIISYLSGIALKTGNKTFEINFDRQQLADYLNVDRSALSAELSKMKTENLIDFNKNKFTLK